MAIIPLTHVCRYWRESIVSTPQNWKTISNFQRNLLEVSLERAKSALLEIHLDMDGIREDPQFFDLLVPHFQNTEILLVTELSTIEDLLPISQHPLTNLRSLILDGRGAISRERSIDPFKSSAHPLRYLELCGVPLYPSFLNLRTLTGLDLRDAVCNLHLDTILDFLEENHSLTSVELGIQFTHSSLRSSRRRAPIQNQLRYLWIGSKNVMDIQALISSIALSKGAKLEFRCIGNAGVHSVLSSISTTHLSNLLSPIFMSYRVLPRIIELRGPNGTASFDGFGDSSTPFVEFPQLPLATVRQFRLDRSRWDKFNPPPDSILFGHLTSFPALETFIVQDIDLPHLLSTLLSDPSVSPSLRTLAFSDCNLTEEFMEGLTRFASDRKKTTSAWLHRVAITHRDEILPSVASIRELEKQVPVVDVRIEEGPPLDL